jgi:hypothetical protein
MRGCAFVVPFLIAASLAQTSITIKPRNASITSKQTQQYTASSSAKWYVDGVLGGNSSVGTISASGLYRPPATSGAHTVKAVSTTNGSVSASTKVYVQNHPGVLTFHYDNTRQGRNMTEIALQPANVKSSTFGKLFSRSVDGIIFAQPLYVPAVSVPNKGTFNVVYITTSASSVYAFDADGKTSTPLWTRNFTSSANAIIAATNSIVATPVIDMSTKTMFVLAKMIENGTTLFRLHALDITTGAERFGGPVIVTATVSGTGDGSVNGQITFHPETQHSRPGMLLLSGNVYLGFASPGDVDPYHGWIFSYSATTLSRTVVFNSTRNGRHGGFWQGAAGLSSDGTYIYAVTGDGSNDVTGARTNFGDTVLKLTKSLSVADFFTPTDHAALNEADFDLGGGGALLPPAQINTTHDHIIIVAGKRGDIYVVDRDAMGHLLSGSTANLVQYLPRALGNATTTGDQFFGVGAYWNGSVYFVGNFDRLKQFRLSSGTLSSSPVAMSSSVISGARPSQPVVSSNGSTNGIVWIIDTVNVSSSTTPGVLRAYSARNVGTQLYDSSQAGIRDTMGPAVKFNSAVVVNGKVFVPSKDQITVYGLLP